MCNVIRLLSILVATIGALLPAASAAAPAVGAPPLTADDSLKQIEVDPGLKVELAACEPNVIDPVAIRFDEQGRMWVVEMRDYPTGPTKEFPATSRISVLADQDGDGFFETATVFADGLSFATGLQPWKGGVFVTLAGKVVYLKDANGDGKADVHETWYTGFAEMNEQLRANHPTLGIDNHIYIANGLRGGTVVDARRAGAKPVAISGMDFRFHPQTGEFAAVSGVGQFGLTMDDYGNRFVVTNRNPAIHVVLEDRLLKKNPLLAVSAVATDVAKSEDAGRVFPIGRRWTTSNLHEGQFTAACGVFVYRGDALPREYYGNIFTCDPTGHLVHREVMQSSGVTFRSAPAREGAEFFASRDEWSGPVNLELGPDGALYVVDMYRQIIEHPDWMPVELQKRPNMRAGNDRGRILRVVGQQFQRPAAPRLSALPSVALVDLLGHANAWWRDTAARLLLERQDKSTVASLRAMARSHESPLARIRALRLLAGLQPVDEELLIALCDDTNPRIVEQAVQVAENRVAESQVLRERIAKLVTHDDARVRFAAWLVAMPLPTVPPYPADAWEQDAMLIAAGNRGGTALKNVLTESGALRTNLADAGKFVERLARLAAAARNDAEQTTAIAALIGSTDFGQAGLTGFLAETAHGGTSMDQLRQQLDALTNRRLDQYFGAATAAAKNAERSEEARCAAIDLLAYARDPVKTLLPLATTDANQNVRVHAISALANNTDLEPWRLLLVDSARYTPAVQRALLDGVLASVARTSLLLDMIERGQVRPTMLDAVRAKLLLAHRDATIKQRAAKLLSSAIPADREKALAAYRPVLELKADARHGRAVFEKRCSVCHRIGDLGVQVAPDISDSRERTPLQILTDILQPNRAIDSNYFSYTAIASDGLVHTGVLAAETSTSVTLKQQEGKTITLLRSEIDDLHSDGVSLMPEGLEKDIPPQDMADLVSFIKNWRYLDNPVQAPSAGL